MKSAVWSVRCGEPVPVGDAGQGHEAATGRAAARCPPCARAPRRRARPGRRTRAPTTASAPPHRRRRLPVRRVARAGRTSHADSSADVHSASTPGTRHSGVDVRRGSYPAGRGEMTENGAHRLRNCSGARRRRHARVLRGHRARRGARARRRAGRVRSTPEAQRRGIELGEANPRPERVEGAYTPAAVADATSDSLQIFLRDISQRRLLTAAEEVELAKRIERGDQARQEPHDRGQPPPRGGERQALPRPRACRSST